MKVTQKKYMTLLEEISVETMYLKAVERRMGLLSLMERARDAIVCLSREVDRLKALAATASCDLVRVSKERDHLSEAVARIAKERDEKKALLDAAMLTAETTPVVHGRWIPKDSKKPFSWRYCSECGHTVPAAMARSYKGCPICLARMDGE